MARCEVAMDDNRDLVVIGGSTGCTAPLKQILRRLPRDLPAAIAVVVHIPSGGSGIFVTVAAAASSLPVKRAEDGEQLQRGTIYVAPPDRHLLIVDGRVKLGYGPRENLVRPAVDPLFRSAALSSRSRAIGVILSGKLNDGASGLAAIKSCGGIALVQTPQSAEASEMPLAALEASAVDLSAGVEDLALAIEHYARERAGPERQCAAGLNLEVEIAAGTQVRPPEFEKFTTPITITCPDCGGVLSAVNGGHPLRFRCQVGHAFSAQVLLREQEDQVDEAMRVALRIIEERADLVSRMGRDAQQIGRPGMAELYERRALEYRNYAESLREAVLRRMDATSEAMEAQTVVENEVHGSPNADEL
jgi:two-component system chemotaxis response regulator CheB